MGEGNRIQFWCDPWSGHLPLRELYPDLFACSISKEVMVCVGFFSRWGSRSWNLRAFQDWELEDVYSFFEFLYSKLPGGDGDDKLSWRLSFWCMFLLKLYF